MKTLPSLRISACLLALLPILAGAQEKDKPAEPPKPPEPAPAEHAPEDQSSDPFGGGNPFDSNRRRPIAAASATQEKVQLRLRLETWEATALDVVRWLDETKDSTALEKLRADFVAEKRAARLVFSPTVAIDQSGKENNESIAEWIYPTEYEPPELPAPPTADGAAKPETQWQKWLESTAGKFACPTSFETRNTGQTFEAEVQPIKVAPGHWDLSVSFDCVDTPGNLHYGEKDSQIEMPLFGSFRTGGLVRLKEGQWRLLSVMEPPRGLDGKPSDKRWITIVRIDPEK